MENAQRQKEYREWKKLHDSNFLQKKTHTTEVLQTNKYIDENSIKRETNERLWRKKCMIQLISRGKQ